MSATENINAESVKSVRLSLERSLAAKEEHRKIRAELLQLAADAQKIRYVALRLAQRVNDLTSE